MKIGSFVMGGLAGAALVMLMKNQTVTSITSGINQLVKQRANKAASNAKLQGLKLAFGNADAAADDSASASGHSAGGIEQVKQLAAKDAQVKEETNRILQQNNESTI